MLTVADLLFTAALPASDVPSTQQKEAREKLFQMIKDLSECKFSVSLSSSGCCLLAEMGRFYPVACERLGVPVDARLADELAAANAEGTEGFSFVQFCCLHSLLLICLQFRSMIRPK